MDIVLLKFLHNLQGTKFKIDQKKFQNVIESTDFERMKNLEKKDGFFEGKTNTNTGEKIPFFNPIYFKDFFTINI